MKNRNLKFYSFSFWLLAFSFLLFTGMKCKKDKTGIDALPPATQEGKGTFGCLVNGEVFLPKGNFSSGNPLLCFYQFSQSEKKYHLSISASNNSQTLIDVAIGYSGPGINTGNFILKKRVEGQYYGEHTKYIGGSIFPYTTDDNFTGELNITKFDQTNQIISGVFWFDAINKKGEKVEVREGRFDCLFKK